MNNNIAYLPEDFDFEIKTCEINGKPSIDRRETTIIIGSLPEVYNAKFSEYAKCNMLKIPMSRFTMVTPDIMMFDDFDKSIRYLITNKEYMGLPKKATQTFNSVYCREMGFVRVYSEQTETTWEMFSDCEIDTLDISGIHAPNVTSVYQMFSGALISELILGDFMGCKANNFHRTFVSSVIESVDISGIDFSNMVDTSGMFLNAAIRKIDTTRLMGVSKSTIRDILYRARVEKVIYPKNFIWNIKMRLERLKSYHYNPAEIPIRLGIIQSRGGLIR